MTLKLKKKTTIGAGLGLVLILTLVTTPAFAETENTANTEGGFGPHSDMMGSNTRTHMDNPEGNSRMHGQMMEPAVMGSVSTISGTTITLNGRKTPGQDGVATFSIDASNAVVYKNDATSSVSSIATGDMIFVQGTVNETNVLASVIRDGVRGVGFGKDGKEMMGRMRRGHRNASSTLPAIVGNGQPLVAGKISAVIGNILTVTTGNNVSYTVDATNAKIMQGKTEESLSALVVGNEVIVQGTVNGTSITASTIIQPHHKNEDTNSVSSNNNSNPQPEHHGFFESIGGFFTHLFGF
ncbi:MAG: hypothetical protein WCG97_01865 [bacterium]